MIISLQTQHLFSDNFLFYLKLLSAPTYRSPVVSDNSKYTLQETHIHPLTRSACRQTEAADEWPAEGVGGIELIKFFLNVQHFAHMVEIPTSLKTVVSGLVRW